MTPVALGEEVPVELFPVSVAQRLLVGDTSGCFAVVCGAPDTYGFSGAIEPLWGILGKLFP